MSLLSMVLALCLVTGFRLLADDLNVAGVVLDEQGHPVTGALVLDAPEVSAVAPSFRPPGQGVLAITDAKGRWSLTNAPGRLLFAHPDFVHEETASTAEVVLLRAGVPVRGMIVDVSGRGIEGARILGGDFPAWTPTGGRFELKNCRPGSVKLVVEAPGFAASWTEMAVREPVGEIRWVMPHSHSRQLRVVDTGDRAIADAEVAIERWEAPVPWDWHWHTDTNGLVSWANAPIGEVRCVVKKAGFRSEHGIFPAAEQSDRRVVLHRERIVAGRVRDESGRAIESFSVLSLEQRMEAAGWRAEKPDKGANDGEFVLLLPGEAPVIVRVDVPGFESDVSRLIEPGEELVPVEFKLRPLERLVGSVRDANNEPVPGAEVTWASPETPASLGKAAFARGSGTTVAFSDEAGRFELRAPRRATALFAASAEVGFAAASLDEVRRTGTLHLKPWGRIEGDLVLNGKPQSRRLVVLGSYGLTNLAFLANAFAAVTDEAGRFEFRYVPPGLHQAGQIVRRRLSHAVQVEVRPGLCAPVQVGGNGVRVVGRLRVPEADPIWEETSAPAGLRPQDNKSGAFYQFEFGEAGAFHVESVPPGRYELEAHWHEIADGTDREICHGAWRTSVVVPNQAEVDMGELTWRAPVKGPQGK